MIRDLLRRKLNILRTQLVALLRLARVVVVAQSSETSLFIVCDKITVKHMNDTTHVEINGMDISEALSSVQITCKPGDYPEITMRYKQEALKLNPAE